MNDNIKKLLMLTVLFAAITTTVNAEALEGKSTEKLYFEKTNNEYNLWTTLSPYDCIESYFNTNDNILVVKHKPTNMAYNTLFNMTKVTVQMDKTDCSSSKKIFKGNDILRDDATDSEYIIYNFVPGYYDPYPQYIVVDYEWKIPT